MENNENTDTYLYRAIVPEQIIAQGSTLLEVYGVNGGKNYVFKAPNKSVTYPQGKYFRMEVTIGENNVVSNSLLEALNHGNRLLVLIWKEKN